MTESVLITIVLIALFGITLFIFIPWLSSLVSEISIYHSKKLEEERERKKKLWPLYVKLSIVLISTYSVILITLTQELNYYVMVAVCSLSYFTLIALRHFGNPSEDCLPAIIRHFSDKDKSSIIEQHRERFISFIFSLVAVQMLLVSLVPGQDLKRYLGENNVMQEMIISKFAGVLQDPYPYAAIMIAYIVLLYFGIGRLEVVLSKDWIPVNQIRPPKSSEASDRERSETIHSDNVVPASPPIAKSKGEPKGKSRREREREARAKRREAETGNNKRD